MGSDKMPPIYPGEVLLEEFIVPLGTTSTWITLQSRYDLDVEQDNLGAGLDLISPLRLTWWTQADKPNIEGPRDDVDHAILDKGVDGVVQVFSFA